MCLCRSVVFAQDGWATPSMPVSRHFTTSTWLQCTRPTFPRSQVGLVHCSHVEVNTEGRPRADNQDPRSGDVPGVVPKIQWLEHIVNASEVCTDIAWSSA
jgi:hypothetical protein